MLFYISGTLYYSCEIVWLTALAVPCGALAVAAASHYRLCEVLSDEVRALLYFILDYSLAATLLSGVLWYPMVYSFTFAGRAELHALRGVSAVAMAGAATALVVQLLSRPVLAASAMLYVGASLNASCWWAELWLYLQEGGIVRLLSPSLRHMLLHERPIDWLRRDDFSRLLLRVRELLPLLVLPESELHHGFAILPAELQARLQQPGLVSVLPPCLLRTCIEPWARGNEWLRVEHLKLSVPRLRTNGHGERSAAEDDGTERVRNDMEANGDKAIRARGLNGCTHTSLTGGSAVGVTGRTQAKGGVVADAPGAGCAVHAAAPSRLPPEWLVLYALRCHVTGALRSRSQELLRSSLQSRAPFLAAIGGLGALALALQQSRLASWGAFGERGVGRSRVSWRRRVAVLLAAVAVAHVASRRSSLRSHQRTAV